MVKDPNVPPSTPAPLSAYTGYLLRRAYARDTVCAVVVHDLAPQQAQSACSLVVTGAGRLAAHHAAVRQIVGVPQLLREHAAGVGEALHRRDVRQRVATGGSRLNGAGRAVV